MTSEELEPLLKNGLKAVSLRGKNAPTPFVPCVVR